MFSVVFEQIKLFPPFLSFSLTFLPPLLANKKKLCHENLSHRFFFLCFLAFFTFLSWWKNQIVLRFYKSSAKTMKANDSDAINNETYLKIARLRMRLWNWFHVKFFSPLVDIFCTPFNPIFVVGSCSEMLSGDLPTQPIKLSSFWKVFFYQSPLLLWSAC